MEDQLKIHTIQSYLVFETEKFYQKVIAREGISHFYSFKCGEKDTDVPLMADGCSNLLFEYSSSDINSFFIGNTDSKTELNLKKNHEYFGIRFEPGTNPFFTNQEVKDLINTKISLDDFSILKGLTDKMGEQTTFTTRMCAFLEEYRKLLNGSDAGKKELFLQMVRLVVKKDGLLKITELEKLSGYSNRYINLLFETNLGCSAKQFCSIVRMHSLINILNKNQDSSFVDLANKFNFYDQSHFVHSFKDFTGMTPGDYIASVKSQDYVSKIINIGE